MELEETLSQIAQELEKKGFERQAVLLQTKNSEVYLACLVGKESPAFIQAIGQELFSETYFALKDSDWLSLAQREFHPRALSLPSMHITRDSFYREEDLFTCASLLDVLHKERKEAYKGLLDTVEQVQEKEPFALSLAYATIAPLRTFSDYKESVELHVRIGGTSDLEVLKRESIDCLKYSYPYADGTIARYLALNNEVNEIYERDLMQAWYDQQAETPEGEERPRIQVAQEELQAHREHILLTMKDFLSSEKKLKEAHKMYRQTFAARIETLTQDSMRTNLYLFESEHPLVHIQDHMEGVLFQKMSQKKELFQQYKEYIIHSHDEAVGYRELAEGGRVLCQEHHRYSICQNHAAFPNFDYSTEQRAAFGQSAEKLENILNKLPDISDMILSRKIQGKKEIDFCIEELAKEPMDVSFGNDGGCCIAVPTSTVKGSNQENFSTVPLYLIDPRIRLFAIYTLDGTRRKRVGLIPAFETVFRKDIHKNPQGKTILSCNSLELSQFGIPGGQVTQKGISQYAEEWIEEYTKTHGYIGATMSNHSPNISVRYSPHVKETVSGPLVFLGDIQKNLLTNCFEKKFHRGLGRNIYQTEKNSCYWIVKN